MIETGETPKSVCINVDPTLVPELLSTLAPFVAKHSLEIRFGDPNSSKSIAAIGTESVSVPALNPELVSLMETMDEPGLIPCITIAALMAFEKKHGLQKGLARRFAQVLRPTRLADGFGPYLATLPNDNKHWHGSPDIKVVGIKAHSAHELLGKLEDGTLNSVNIGPGSIGFFRKYCDALFIDSPSV